MYADVELDLIGWLVPQFSGSRLCSELPNSLVGDTIQVVQFGGPTDDIPFAEFNVDIDVYSLTRARSRQLAREVQQAVMYALPGTKIAGSIYLSASTISAPSWAPYDNTSVRRTTATYRIRTHNPI